MTIQKVTLIGGGTLGSQIAFQIAVHGFETIVYDVNEDAITAVKQRMQVWGQDYEQKMAATPNQIQAANARLAYTTSLAEAVKDADLVIEAAPEITSLKTELYQQLGQLAPAKTIFATNSSTLLPSQFAAATGRPKQFLAFHFANEIWVYNTAEIMGQPETDPAVYQTIVEFAGQIGMVPIEVKKEQPGYVLNSLLVPLLTAGGRLWITGVADPETIDKTWMIATGAPIGPMAYMDMIGLRTVYNISLDVANSTHDPVIQQFADKIKADFLDQGLTGQETQHGFYTYPNPTYLDPAFLKAPTID